MSEYLINSGEFNIIVRPEHKEYFILENDQASTDVLDDFINSKDVSYEKLPSYWFKYDKDEVWRDLENEKNEYRLNVNVGERELIDKFVLKKFNFGSLVAVRNTENGQVKIFKQHMLNTSPQG